MKLLFLLGSGISLPSGVHGVREITKALFNVSYYEHTDQSFIRVDAPLSIYQQHYDARPIQDFLQLMKERNDAFLSKKWDRTIESTYEDLYFLIDQVVDEHERSDNIGLQCFVQELESASLPYRRKYHTAIGVAGRTPALVEFCRRAKVFIESVVKYGIWDAEPRELDLLVSLARDERVHRLDLFTLNHDTLIERLFDSEGVTFCDGFTEPDGDGRWLETSLHDESRINIYHLHGAKSWCITRISENGRIDQRVTVLTGQDPYHCKRGDGSLIDLLITDGYLLTGANKHSKYQFRIYGELFLRFRQQLYQARRIVVSGYGWNDYGMNFILLDWLVSRPENKILLIHRDPETMANDSRHLSARRMVDYITNGKIVTPRKWFGEATADEIMDFNGSE